MTTLLARDEREVAVDHAADRLSYLVLAYGLLAIAAVRGLNGEASWDLLGLVVLGGVVGLGYRLRERVVGRTWAVVLAGSILLAAGIAAVVAFASR